MSDSNDNFAREFFNRPENDDTIEQFKRQYMTSKKNYEMAMDSNNDANLSGGRFNERDIGSPPSKPHPRANGPGSVRTHNVATSRLSSTATLSNNNNNDHEHQDLSRLRDEVQKLINAREKDNFDKINLKSALNNLDSRLNNLENVILKSQSQSQSQSINNSSRPQSYESYGRDPHYHKRKDESYDYMLKDELKRNGYREQLPQYYNKNKSNYINHTNYIPPSPPQRYATSSARYSSPPVAPLIAQQRYYSDSYGYDRNKRVDDNPPFRSNRFNDDDASTLDLINGRI